MGLKVTTDLAVLKNKELVDFNFNHGNEYVLVVKEKKSDVLERVRIPAFLKDMFETYWAMVQNDKVSAR